MTNEIPGVCPLTLQVKVSYSAGSLMISKKSKVIKLFKFAEYY